MDLNKVCLVRANHPEPFSMGPSPGVVSERADLPLTTRSWCNYNTNCPRHHLLLSFWACLSQQVTVWSVHSHSVLNNSNPVLSPTVWKALHHYTCLEQTCDVGWVTWSSLFLQLFLSKVMLSQWGWWVFSFLIFALHKDPALGRWLQWRIASW